MVKSRVLLLLLLAAFALPIAHAAARDDIAGKLCDVVNLVKYVAGAIAVLAFAVLGVQFMTVGSNPMARDDLKTKMGYVGVGMFVILVSNFIVAIFLPTAATCPLV